MNSHRRIGPDVGAGLVDFALSVIWFLVLMMAVYEFGYALYAWNTLTHATLMGARYAVSNPANITNIRNVVVFGNSSGAGGPILAGLTVNHVRIRYKNLDNTVQFDSGANPDPAICTPAPQSGTPPTLASSEMVVEVSIVGYKVSLFIPEVPLSITVPCAVPNFTTTTLILESLGGT